jgi:hypothetical protein
LQYRQQGCHGSSTGRDLILPAFLKVLNELQAFSGDHPHMEQSPIGTQSHYGSSDAYDPIVTTTLDGFDQRDYYQAIGEAIVIDVSSHIQIRRPRDEVGAYALNLDNARKWVANLSSLEWITPPPLAVRSRIRLVTELFGHRLIAAYTSTHMTVRGRADPGGFLSLLTPMIADELRESYRGDLLRLKRILESERSGSAY